MTIVAPPLRSSLESAAMGDDMWREAATMADGRVNEDTTGPGIDGTPEQTGDG